MASVLLFTLLCAVIVAFASSKIVLDRAWGNYITVPTDSKTVASEEGTSVSVWDDICVDDDDSVEHSRLVDACKYSFSDLYRATRPQANDDEVKT